MKLIEVEMTFKGSVEIEVPDDWEYDGLKSLVEYDDLSCATSELVDWDWREKQS